MSKYLKINGVDCSGKIKKYDRNVTMTPVYASEIQFLDGTIEAQISRWLSTASFALAPMTKTELQAFAAQLLAGSELSVEYDNWMLGRVTQTMRVLDELQFGPVLTRGGVEWFDEATVTFQQLR